MKTKAVIYHRSKNKPMLDFFQSRRRKIGYLMLGLSFCGFLFFFSPFIAIKQEKKKASAFGALINQKIEPINPLGQIQIQASDEPEKTEASPKPTEVKSFYLTIEKIGLFSAPIIPKIDANNKEQYQKALAMGLVHAQSTALPDEENMVYIFGHSTNYIWNIKQINALFYGIEKLENNDRVKIEFNGKSYVYYVYDRKIVQSENANIIENEANQDVLVLQSCWPPGTSLKRILVFCRPSKFGGLIY